MKKKIKFQFTLLELIGFIFIGTGIFFLFSNTYFAIFIFIFFITLTVIAPFIPSTNLFLPVVTKGNSDKNIIALTFDDGPDPFTTLKILKLLAKYNAKATFFVTGYNTLKYPNLIKKILDSGHSIGNHTYHHDIFIMLKSKKKLENEILATQKILKQFGIVPLVFRPPVGIVNPKLGQILAKIGMYCVTFSNRAFDRGNRKVHNISNKILGKIKPGQIIMMHDKMPKEKTLLPVFLKQVELLLCGLRAKKIKIIPLSELIKKQVMLENLPPL